MSVTLSNVRTPEAPSISQHEMFLASLENLGFKEGKGRPLTYERGSVSRDDKRIMIPFGDFTTEFLFKDDGTFRRFMTYRNE